VLATVCRFFFLVIGICTWLELLNEYLKWRHSNTTFICQLSGPLGQRMEKGTRITDHLW